MKRIISVLMTVLLLCNISSFAKEESIMKEISLDTVYSEDYVETDLTEYRLLGEKMLADSKLAMEKGLRASLVKYKWYYPTSYTQGGMPWSNDQLGNSSYTIGSHGCALTSFAMLASLHGSTDDPGDVNSTMGSYAVPFAWDVGESRYNLPTMHYSSSTLSNSDAEGTLAGILENTDVAVVGMKYGSNGTHFVLARGFRLYTDDLKIDIYDPGSKGYTELQDYFDDGYTVNRIIFYD